MSSYKAKISAIQVTAAKIRECSGRKDAKARGGEVPSTPSHHKWKISRSRRHKTSHAATVPRSAKGNSQYFRQAAQEDPGIMHTDYASTSQPAKKGRNL